MAAAAKSSTYPSKWIKNQQNPPESSPPPEKFPLFAVAAIAAGRGRREIVSPAILIYAD